MEYENTSSVNFEPIVNKSMEFVRLLAQYENASFKDPDTIPLIKNTKMCVAQMCGLLITTNLVIIKPSENEEKSVNTSFKIESPRESFKEVPRESFKESPLEKEQKITELKADKISMLDTENKTLEFYISDNESIGADQSFISTTVHDGNEKIDIKYLLGDEKIKTPLNIPKNPVIYKAPKMDKNVSSNTTEESNETKWVENTKRTSKTQKYDMMTAEELLQLDMSKIPHKMIGYKENIVAHEKFNMFANDDDEFIRSRTHGGIFVGSGGWMLNKNNGFIYVQTDKTKPPHPSFFAGKFWKWNIETYIKNHELFRSNDENHAQYPTINDFVTV